MYRVCVRAQNRPSPRRRRIAVCACPNSCRSVRAHKWRGRLPGALGGRGRIANIERVSTRLLSGERSGRK